MYLLHGRCIHLNSQEAATADSDQEEGTPGSTSRPRCDGCDGWMWPPVAMICLFQSAIVWHSVITVYVTSNSQSPVCTALLLTKEKGFIGKKWDMCFLTLTTCPSTEKNGNPPLLLSSLSFCYTHTPVVAAHIEWEMFGCHGNTFPKWNKCLAAYAVK